MQTEAELIAKVLRGEWRNYAILVDKYEQKIYNYVHYLLGNREDAEEVTQDTFTKAYQSLSQFRGDAAFSTWLLRIAHHKCLSRFRKKVYPHIEIEKALDREANNAEDPTSALQQVDRSMLLNHALGKLKADERSVITMFYYQELSIKEIVEITHYKESNVKIQLHRGRKKLFDILSSLGIKEFTLS